MTYFFKILLLFPFLIMLGCTGSSGGGVTDTTSITTCYDIEIINAGNSQTNNICLTKENGGHNGLGVARFLKFTVASTASVSIKATRTSGIEPSDPDLYIFKQGDLIKLAEGTARNSELIASVLTAGDYVVEINEFAYFNSFDKQDIGSSINQKLTDNNVQVQATAASDCSTGNNSIVSGNIVFDRVHHSGSALDYFNITQEPAQQVLVEVICNGGAYSSTTTDLNGDYTNLIFPNNQSSFVRVNAQMVNGSSWNFSIVNDAVLGQPIYVMDDTTLPATGNTTRNLRASSGWGGTSYTGARVAGPFAILDSIRKAKDKILSVATVNFPPLKINWTPTDALVDGSGIGSFYNGSEIFILGAENGDTDEYDEHVIIHEWGHYFENNFSRSDSIGGKHSSGDILDIRVAFGEGFGNAFSAIVTDDPIYKDSNGTGQTGGFSINIESNTCTNSGWFSECSVQAALYDIYDNNNDAPDTLNLGFAPIYNVLVGAQKTTPAMTSVLSFMTYFKNQNAASVSAIDAMMNNQNIDSVLDIYGSNQITSNPGSIDQLPVYHAY